MTGITGCLSMTKSVLEGMQLFDCSCDHPPSSCTGLNIKQAAEVPIELRIDYSTPGRTRTTASRFIGCTVEISERENVASANPGQWYTLGARYLALAQNSTSV